jgi:O-antigen/teichoic acid export membrane protein
LPSRDFLGPTAFGHATAVYTLLILISAVTLSFQIVSAKVVAQQNSLEGKSAAYRGFHKSAWACGIIVAMLLLMLQKAIAGLPQVYPVQFSSSCSPLASPFYVPLGTRRGYIQGAYGFQRLGWQSRSRRAGTARRISPRDLALGFGVPGVIAANAAGVAVAYLAAAPKLAPGVPSELHRSRRLSRSAAGDRLFCWPGAHQ